MPVLVSVWFQKEPYFTLYRYEIKRTIFYSVGTIIDYNRRLLGCLFHNDLSIMKLVIDNNRKIRHLASKHETKKRQVVSFHYRIWPQYQPSWPPRYRGGPDGWEQCFLSFALPRERYPPGRHWRAGPYLYGSNVAS